MLLSAFLKNWPAGKFSGINLPSKQTISFADRGRGRVAQDTKLPQKVADSKRSLSIIHMHCRLCMYVISQWLETKANARLRKLPKLSEWCCE
jgi:hypothetical protein